MKRLLVLGIVAVVVLSGCYAYAPIAVAAIPVASVCTPEPEPNVPLNPSGELDDPDSTLPQPAPPAEGDCSAKSGMVIRHTVKLEGLDDPLYVRVYQPPCYDKDAADPGYPVLILLHGQSFNEDQWERLGVVEMADRMILGGYAPPFMIVMPRESRDLVDPKEAVYGEELVDVILPWVDEHYATCTQRECRAIGGISRGAAWAVREGLMEWESFGAIGAHSLPPFRGDIYSLPYWLAAFPSTERPRLYLDIGIEDRYFEAGVLFEAALTDYRVPHEWHLNRGGHNEAYWGAHAEDYLRWYAAGWSE